MKKAFAFISDIYSLTHPKQCLWLFCLKEQIKKPQVFTLTVFQRIVLIRISKFTAPYRVACVFQYMENTFISTFKRVALWLQRVLVKNLPD